MIVNVLLCSLCTQIPMRGLARSQNFTLPELLSKSSINNPPNVLETLIIVSSFRLDILYFRFVFQPGISVTASKINTFKTTSNS